MKTKTKSGSQKQGAEKRKAELTPKRKRQYKHILESEKKEGRPVKSAKRIAMAGTIRILIIIGLIGSKNSY